MSLATNEALWWGLQVGQLAQDLVLHSLPTQMQKSHVAPADGTKGHSRGTGLARDSKGFLKEVAS